MDDLQLLKNIIGNVSHDLRTPLATINLSAGAYQKALPIIHKLKSGELSPDKLTPKFMQQLEMLDKVNDNTQKAIRAACHSLELMLINVNATAINPKDFLLCSIQENIDDVLRNYPLQNGEAELIDYQPNHDFVYLGNNTLTKNVLFNLLKNALYAIKSSNKPDARIYITLESNTDYNILKFKDTGCGISKENLSRIFEPFFSTRTSGNGLGLPFCQRVMNAYDGKIECFSRENQYTEFQLKFPIVSLKED
jgi:two-component system CAI-1 autoinducer sensor kinase/phosphatase CqsS